MESLPGREVEMKPRFFALSLLTLTVATMAGCSADQSTAPNPNGSRDPERVTASVTGGGSGSGRVTSSPAGIDCSISGGVASGACSSSFDQNSAVTYTATPAAASSFQGWSGACAGTSGCTLTMGTSLGIGANFTTAAPPSNTCTLAMALGTLAPGQTISGALSASDCTLKDGSYADVYKLVVSSSQTVQITMTSSAFDPFLVLYGSDGSVIATDDNSGGGTTARISRAVVAGTYYVGANGPVGATGAYQIALAGVNTDPIVDVVLVSPASVALLVGNTWQFGAVARDGAGNNITGRVFAWTSSDPAIASVSSTGLVTARASGQVIITATTGGKSGQGLVAITNMPPPPPTTASVSVIPSTTGLEVGRSLQFTAQARDANGNVISGKVFSWTSSNSSYATVSANGVVTGIAAGTAIITASVDGRSGSSSVTVTASPASGATLVITNQLIYPINISVNGAVVGSVPAQSTRQTTSTATNIVLSWELVRPTVGGRPVGDPMAGTFNSVPGSTGTINYTVDNLVGSQWYFAPVITNSGGQNWLMGVNMGLTSENRCNCVVNAGTSNVAFGYYRLYSNSNVRAYLQSNGYTGQYFVWTNFTVDRGSGLVSLRY
jgi:uncharacterized protein YjdB